MTNRGVLRRGQVSGYACTNRVQINVNHARQYRLFIQQRLAFEASFPESSRAAIFSVCLTGNRLAQATHEPRYATQAATQLLDPSRVTLQALYLGLAQALVRLPVHAHRE